jgi:hypothetical protein
MINSPSTGHVCLRSGSCRVATEAVMGNIIDDSRGSQTGTDEHWPDEPGKPAGAA